MDAKGGNLEVVHFNFSGMGWLAAHNLYKPWTSCVLRVRVILLTPGKLIHILFQVITPEKLDMVFCFDYVWNWYFWPYPNTPNIAQACLHFFLCNCASQSCRVKYWSCFNWKWWNLYQPRITKYLDFPIYYPQSVIKYKFVELCVWSFDISCLFHTHQDMRLMNHHLQRYDVL
jgi:hypothetical protein